MRSKLLSAMVAASLALPLVAAAGDNVTYSYADLAYVTTDIDGVDEELDGFALRGSLEVTDRAFIFGTYADQTAESGGVDVDYTNFTLGGGYAWPLSDSADLYGKLGYVSAEVEVDVPGFGGFSVDDDGFMLGAGLRGRVSQQFELEGAVNYTDFSEGGDDTSLGAAARWFFTNQFSAFAEGEFGDDVTTYGIGMRWNFGGNSGGQRVAQQQ
jgi:Outer membrane protein beta-barrel domain